MRQSADEDLVAAIGTIMPEIGPPRGLPARLSPELRQAFLEAMPGLKERAKNLVELVDSAYYLYARRPLALDEKASGLLANGGRERLVGIVPRLRELPDWNSGSIEEAVRIHAEAAGAKLGQVAQPLRAALTGRATSPGIFDVMAVLGRQETVARIADQTGEA
jgi:glutamyl-tRNA synthetase